MIDTIIINPDSFEAVRDKIGEILLTETASQQQLAADGGYDPDDWRFRVFVERSNPWEMYLSDKPNIDTAPIINITVDNLTFDESSSNTVADKKERVNINIDCYAYAAAQSTVQGHTPGDKGAALRVQQTVRLVRNILMASEYTYLGLRGVVHERALTNGITFYQPDVDPTAIQRVSVARLGLEATVVEYSPQTTPEILESIGVDVYRQETGELYFSTEYLS